MNIPNDSIMLDSPSVALTSYLDGLLGQMEPVSTIKAISDVPQPGKPVSISELRASEFEVSLVDIAGLRFAVPSLRVLADIPCGSELAGAGTSVFHLINFQGRPVKAFDLFTLLVPAGMQASLAQKRRVARHLILDGGSWAISVADEMVQTRVFPDQVSWAKDTGSRPWLAGVIGAKRAALLDLDIVRDSINKLQITD